MHLVYINPNATSAMTDAIVATARAALPAARITGLTNTDGPPAIEGREDGEAAIAGVLAQVAVAQGAGADAIIIACFDDTGLAEAKAAAHCPVLGIGHSAYMLAALAGGRFSVVTSLPVSVPVIEDNIARSGFAASCAAVHACGLPVLDIDAGSEAARARLAQAIRKTCEADQPRSVILGCAGMAPLRRDLEARTGARLIDGVSGSAYLAAALVGPPAGAKAD